jgi:hypothetical protein
MYIRSSVIEAKMNSRSRVHNFLARDLGETDHQVCDAGYRPIVYAPIGAMTADVMSGLLCSHDQKQIQNKYVEPKAQTVNRVSQPTS